MNTHKVLIIFLLIVALAACKKNDEPIVIDDSNLLIGNWINPTAMDTLWKYERANSLIENDYGFSFEQGQAFIERKNAGWCGTPPITYANFDGTWTSNDTIINITVDYWGGTADYQWKIISLDESSLVIYRTEVYNWEE
jgi:hypothetical protein